MKLLYVVNIAEVDWALKIKAVNFKVVHVIEETETSYITLDKINVCGFVKEFPKSDLNYVFSDGFVTDKLDKAELKRQIERIRKSIDKVNEVRYEDCIAILENIK